MKFSILRLIEKDGTGIHAVTEKDGTGIRASRKAIEKDGTGIGVGSILCSALMAIALVAPVSATEFGGIVNQAEGRITMSLSDGSSLLTGTGLSENGYAIVALNAVELPSAIQSEGDGTGVSSEGDGTGVKSEGDGTGVASEGDGTGVASEGDGTGVASEGDGTGVAREGDGTGVARVCFSGAGIFGGRNGDGFTKSEGDGTGVSSEGDGTGVASEGDGTGISSEGDGTGAHGAYESAGYCETGPVALSWGVAEIALNGNSASVLLYGIGGNGLLTELAAIEVPVINH